MCGGPERSNTTCSTDQPPTNTATTTTTEMNNLTVETESSLTCLLDLASDNDLKGFKEVIESDASAINKTELWLVRNKCSNKTVYEERTPLMVAAIYGSIDVLKFIICQPNVDVDQSVGQDKWTALHCAASGGSINAVEIVKLLICAGADPNIEDAQGLRPVDLIVVPRNLPENRASLEELLMSKSRNGCVNLRVTITNSNTTSPTLSSSPENGSPFSPSSPITANNNTSAPEKKEYPIDPSLPDIKNSIYSTDEFRMFQFKVRPCSRAYSHDWTECPFVHPGENARRRDPRKYHYSCVPCPDFRKAACRRGDMCEYAHGVFECWLHPAQYRTRLCKDGTSCARRVCFFAHLPEELRPLYVSTGSAVPSPRSVASAATVMDMAAALSLFPGSPSHSMMSPTGNQGWPQPNVPTLHLPGSNIQSSRLRSSLSARDIPPDDLRMLQEFDVLNNFSQGRSNLNLNRSSGRVKTTLTPSNLEELFSAEMGSSSPRYADQGVFSPSHKSAVFNSFQQQQNMLSPINTNVFSPKNMEHPLMQAPFGMSSSSPRGMSPRSVDPISPMSARLSAFANRERQQLRSLSSRELGSHSANLVGSPMNNNNNSWTRWGSPNGKVDWSTNGGGGGGGGRVERSSSFELKDNGEEPDVSWVQSLVKESSPPEMKDKLAGPVSGAASSGEVGENDHSVLGAWLEQMQLDQQQVVA